MALWGVRSGILNLITMIHIQTEDGDELLTIAPLKDFQSIAFSSPALEQGTEVEVYYGGSSTGAAVGGVYTMGEQIASFTISNVVTTVGTGGQ